MKKLQSKSERQEQSLISLRIPRVIKKQLQKAADENHRSLSKQVLFFVEQGVKHLKKFDNEV